MARRLKISVEAVPIKNLDSFISSLKKDPNYLHSEIVSFAKKQEEPVAIIKYYILGETIRTGDYKWER